MLSQPAPTAKGTPFRTRRWYILPMVRLLVVALLAVATLRAQPLPPAMDAAVVGIFEAAQVLDQGSTIRVAGHLRVARVLTGQVELDSRLPLSWEYRAAPYARVDPAKRFPEGPCVWLLRRAGDAWQPEPFLSDRGADFAGGFALPLPGESIPPQFWPPPGAPWQRALAHELRWTLDSLAQRHGAALNPRRKLITGGAFISSLTPPQRLFTAAANLLWSLPEEHTLPSYRGLFESPFPNARMAGLAGLLRAARPGAARDLEREWPLLEPAIESLRLARVTYAMRLMPVEDQLALARIAVSESGAPHIEQAVALQLAHTGRPALPFLALFLAHPSADVRSSAVMSLCRLLGAQMNVDPQYCPSSSPIRDPVREAEASGFWRSRLRELNVESWPRPSRYSAAPESLSGEAPLEDRFWLLAERIVNAGPPHPLLAALDSRDAEALRASCTALVQDEDEHRKAFQRLLHERRLAGAPLPREALDAENKARQAARAAAMEHTRRQLSSSGWQALEQALREMHVVRRQIPLLP